MKEIVTPYRVLAAFGTATLFAGLVLALRKCIKLSLFYDPLSKEIAFIKEKIRSIDPLQGVVPLKLANTQFHRGYFISLVQGLRLKQVTGVQQRGNPFLPPFEKGSSYRLLKNKFPVVRDHLLLITQEECSQLLPIKRKEFALGLSTIRALGRPSLIFFNRGPHSGYSQNHRHLQIIPICDLFHTLKKIQLEVANYSCEKSTTEFTQYSEFKFRHGLMPLRLESDSLDSLLNHLEKAYETLLSRVLSQPDQSYNLLMTEKFMLLVPRSKEKAFGAVSLNSLAFTGSIGVKGSTELELLKTKSFDQVLQDVTFPLR